MDARHWRSDVFWVAVRRALFFGRVALLERRLEPGSSPLPTGWPELARHAWESLRATVIALRADPRGQSSKRQLLPTFWFVLCGMMVFLGFNKQLDLQTCFTQ